MGAPMGFRDAAAPARRVRAVLLLGAALVLLAGPRPTVAQAPAERIVSRNAFVGQPERPEATLAAGAPVTVGAERWRVAGVEALRVVSPDPQLSVVFRYAPLAEPGAGPPAPGSAPGPLRLTVIVIAREGARRHEYKLDGQRIVDGALLPQRAFRVAEGGQQTALDGTPGSVREIVIQDDADVELRLRRDGTVLELQAVPPAAGGVPSGPERPYFEGRPLRFADVLLLAAGYKENALGELWLGDALIGRLNAFFPSGGDDAVVGRAMVTAQLWRGHRISVWLEGGAGYTALTDPTDGSVTDEVRVAWGATLHWRLGDWGAAANAGLVGDRTVLSALGSWQALSWLGAIVEWQSFEGHSGYGLGFSVDF